MWRRKASDPEYSGRVLWLPEDFYKVLQESTQLIPKAQWRMNVSGYYERCFEIAKANPLIILDLDLDIIF